MRSLRQAGSSYKTGATNNGYEKRSRNSAMKNDRNLMDENENALICNKLSENEEFNVPGNSKEQNTGHHTFRRRMTTLEFLNGGDFESFGSEERRKMNKGSSELMSVYTGNHKNVRTQYSNRQENVYSAEGVYGAAERKEGFTKISQKIEEKLDTKVKHSEDALSLKNRTTRKRKKTTSKAYTPVNACVDYDKAAHKEYLVQDCFVAVDKLEFKASKKRDTKVVRSAKNDNKLENACDKWKLELFHNCNATIGEGTRHDEVTELSGKSETCNMSKNTNISSSDDKVLVLILNDISVKGKHKLVEHHVCERSTKSVENEYSEEVVVTIQHEERQEVEKEERMQKNKERDPKHLDKRADKENNEQDVCTISRHKKQTGIPNQSLSQAQVSNIVEVVNEERKLPFCELIQNAVDILDHRKFYTKDHDAESGLDIAVSTLYGSPTSDGCRAPEGEETSPPNSPLYDMPAPSTKAQKEGRRLKRKIQIDNNKSYEASLARVQRMRKRLKFDDEKVNKNKKNVTWRTCLVSVLEFDLENMFG